MNLLFEELRDWWVALLGCIPGRTGRLLRQTYYHAVLADSGPVLSIGEHVEIGCPAHITLGDEIYLVPGAVLRACGGANLKIGDRVAVNGNARITADFGNIVIGSGVMIGPNVVIRASNHAIIRHDIPIWEQGQTGGQIVIGDDVWIGANAVILPGVRVGAHAVVGAGAVVTRDVPDYAVVSGVPASVLRYRSASPQ
jgi:acetyltransferase-like isoleucine patch superfamily enzyme